MKNTDLKTVTQKIDCEWNLIPDGFFFKVRAGIMDYSRYEYVVNLLKEAKDITSTLTDEKIDRDFVKVIWYIPMFLSWQAERIETNGCPVNIYLGQWCTTIENIITEILGEP